MRMNPKIILGLALVFAVCSTATVWAGLTPEEIAKLGKELTPMGAEKAGNADGTIPEWTGGLTEFPAGYTPGEHYVDPYAGDAAKFTITAANSRQVCRQTDTGSDRRCSRPIPIPMR